MSENTIDTTVTDKDSFSVTVVDQSKFSNLSIDEQKLFEFLRNSMLEIFPSTNGKYDADTVRYAENYAFISLKGFNKFFELMVEKRLKLLEESINLRISSMASSMTTTTPTV